MRKNIYINLLAYGGGQLGGFGGALKEYICN
jgi:hypothetical protein